MGNMTTAFLFVMVLNVIMFLSQAAMLDMNPDATNYWSNEGTLLNEFDKNEGEGDPVLDTDEVTNQLPSTEGTVEVSTGNFFTDMFASVKNWFVDTTGLKYLFAIVAAPYNLLKAMNLPQAFAFAMGTLWYALTLFLVIAFFWGRDT